MALRRLIEAAEQLTREWDDALDTGYPAHLPSFDQVAAGLRAWESATSPPHQTARGLTQFWLWMPGASSEDLRRATAIFERHITQAGFRAAAHAWLTRARCLPERVTVEYPARRCAAPYCDGTPQPQGP